MAWVVDTCLLIDVAEADPTFGIASARLLDGKRPDGLTICPATYIELAPVFNGDQTAQNEFLFNLGTPGRKSGSRPTPMRPMQPGIVMSRLDALLKFPSARWRTF